MSYPASIYAAKCLSMQPLWHRRNMMGQSAMPRGSSLPHEASTRRLLPWRVSTPTSPRRRSKACTKRYTIFRDYLVGAIVKGPQRSNSERKSWPPSGSTNGLACHWRTKGNIHHLPHHKAILETNTMMLSVELTKDSQPESGAEMMRCWPLPRMPTKEPWLQPLSSRRRLKGWAVLPADSPP